MSEARDTQLTHPPTPTGYEWLRTRADKLGDDATRALLESGQLEAFEYRREDGELLLVTIKDWLSEHGPLMLRRGFKEHYYHIGPREKDDPRYDPFQPQRAYPHGSISDWPKLFVKCESIAAVEKEASKPHRPAGTTMEKADAPFVERMRVLVEQEGLNPSAAAWKLVKKDGTGIRGNASPDSKVNRLVKRYKATYGNGE
jgi:hypothetical protein